MRLNSKVVVVAEDEATIRRNVAEVLTDVGFDVIEAENAEDALAILRLRAAGVAVLFTDIHMPGSMDGLQLARHARGRWPWIGVLVASGRVTPAPGELPRGSRFLSKPYKFARMVEHIRELAEAT